jgi:hypothetical protein
MTQESTPLNVATLRLSGNDALLDDLVRRLNLQVVSRVKAGDPRRRGGVYAASTLNAPIADAASSGSLLSQIRPFLAECLKHGPTLFGNGVEAELSVGISVGDSIQYVASVDFSPVEMRDLAYLGIALNVTAYPASDGANDPVNLKLGDGASA